ncbi:S-layer homology domain-containing protein [Candidatus Formimonas warabiya]|uniref:SLH domain-containing protein n=1 Tax=Formimonas warabiya TaxID=1761012 RepID=A0A3G1KT36_FORW1|nr:S-layer homology domain-containing protein [Candidatus Formimonas warabiya]ATW25590.1 hypothetical protein DCMF_13225 [Candidatus Formimonas warabiya]
MTNVLKRNCRLMFFMMLLACCFLAVCFTQQALADEEELLAPPAYTALDIPSEGDGTVTFSGTAYTSVITAVYLKDVQDDGDYELLESPGEWSLSENKLTLTISYRLFQEELTNGAYHDYQAKIKATGYEDLEVNLRVVSRAAQNLIVRVFDSQDDADDGTVAYQKVLTLADLQALPQHQQSFTLYCGMAGMGASKARGVYLRDLLNKAFEGENYAFDSGDTMKLRVTDYLRDKDNKSEQKSSFDLALGDLTALTQNAWFGMSSPTYETVFADRYYFPGMFAAYADLYGAVEDENDANYGKSYTWPTLLPRPLTREGAVKVEPMLALQFSQRVLDRAMAGSEQFPHFAGSLEKLADMGMNQNDRYRLCFGQQLASDANGNVQVSPETTRFMITYNIFGIDIIKGDAPAGKVPPALTVATGGNGVKITYKDAMDYDRTLKANPSYTDKVTGVFVNGEELDDAQYDLNVGNLVIEDGVAPAGNYTVKITADGYQDNEISFTVPVKVISYTAATDHSGTAINGTDDQIIKLTVSFNEAVQIEDAAAAIDELSIKLNGSIDITSTPTYTNGGDFPVYATLVAGGDGKSLEFTLHFGFAPYAGYLTVQPDDEITQITGGDGTTPVAWSNIALYVPNGLQLQTLSQTVGEGSTPAAVTKKIIAPASSTRGMVHMLFLKNGVPVGTVNSFGANLTTHYHAYLTLNAATFAEMMPGWFNSAFNPNYDEHPEDADYPITYDGDTVTITEKTVGEGDVLDLRIYAYPQDRDTQADKTALDALIAQASAINGSRYTTATYHALQNELYIARSMAGSIYYLQSEIDGEREALQTTIDSLRRTGGSSGGGSSSTQYYTVSFDSQGGSSVSSQRVEKDDTVSRPTKPTRANYSFDGWYTDKACTKAYDFSDAVTGSFTLYAKWTEAEPGLEPEPDQPAGNSHFTDVPAGHWAAESIDYLVEKGIINGKTATTFAPDDNITRAEFVKILAGIAGIDTTKYSTSSFGDVAANAWFASYVAWAGEAGVSQGADGKFNPNAPITRQEMAAMIARFVEDVAGATLPSVNEAVTFADNGRIAGYAADAVAMMQKAGIINGKGSNQFAPLDNATRAEAAKMLASLMKILEK